MATLPLRSCRSTCLGHWDVSMQVNDLMWLHIEVFKYLCVCVCDIGATANVGSACQLIILLFYLFGWFLPLSTALPVGFTARGSTHPRWQLWPMQNPWWWPTKTSSRFFTGKSCWNWNKFVGHWSFARLLMEPLVSYAESQGLPVFLPTCQTSWSLHSTSFNFILT